MRVETSTGPPPSRAVLAGSIGLVILIWAINFIAAKIGLRSLPAMTLATFRVVLAGAVMFPFYQFCSRLPAFAVQRLVGMRAGPAGPDAGGYRDDPTPVIGRSQARERA